MKTIVEKITAIATNLGWNVRIDTSKTNLIEFEFQQYTSMGQDLVFYAEMRGGNLDSLLDETKDYYEGFDPDYEASLWIDTDGHGKNGAPYHIKDIVSDMESAKAMIKSLYETLKTILS